MNRVLIFALVIFVTIVSCTREEDVPAATTYPYYFIATIDGRTMAYGAGESNEGPYTASLYQRSTQVADSFYIYEGGTLQVTGSPLTNNSIIVALFKRFDHEPDQAERLAMMDTTQYPSAFRDTTGIDIDGAFVSYTDANGTTWTSSGRPQFDSVLQVSSIRDGDGVQSAKIFQASFRGRLYNVSGDSITMENATIRTRVFSP